MVDGRRYVNARVRVTREVNERTVTGDLREKKKQGCAAKYYKSQGSQASAGSGNSIRVATNHAVKPANSVFLRYANTLARVRRTP
jgi:hypothetical protein